MMAIYSEPSVSSAKPNPRMSTSLSTNTLLPPWLKNVVKLATES